MIEGSGSVPLNSGRDPDPGGPKAYGPGFATLVKYSFYTGIVRH